MKIVVLVLMGIGVLTASMPAQAQDVKKSTAKLHFKTGTHYYNTANYEAALVEFQKAHKLFPIPDMLFNIARCYEALGQLDRAVQRYEEYLRKVPRAKNKAMLEERIRNIRRRIEAGKTAEPTTPAPKPIEAPAPLKPTPLTSPRADTPAPEAAQPPQEAADEPTGSRSWKITGWTAIGVGGAALVTAAILGGLASSKTSDYEQAYVDHKPYAEAKELLDSAEGLELGCFVSLGVGVAAAAAGTLILVLKGDARASERPDDDLAGWRVRPTARGFAFDF